MFDRRSAYAEAVCFGIFPGQSDHQVDLPTDYIDHVRRPFADLIDSIDFQAGSLKEGWPRGVDFKPIAESLD